MGIFNGGSFPTSGGSITLTQADYQTLSFNGTTLTISGSNSSVDLSSLLDDTNTTNTTLVLNGNILELTDSDANTITADLSGLTPATPTLQEVTDAGNTTTNDITANSFHATGSRFYGSIGINNSYSLRLSSIFTSYLPENRFINNTIIGQETNPDAKLHVVGGAAATNATALLVENAEGGNLFEITDGGNAVMNVNYLQLDEFVGGRYLKISPAISGANHKIESNSGSAIEISSSTGLNYTLGGSGQLTLNQYTSTNFDGTPTSVLGVDASGNVIKTTSLTTPTLQQVIDAGGSYSGTDDNVSITCGGEGELSLSSHITAITSTGGVTTVNGAGVNIGGSSSVNINPTAGGVHILPTVGDVNIDPVDGDINLTPPSGHKIFAGGTGAQFQIPTWATSSGRPTVSGAADAGTIGYNIGDAALELWNGSAWVTI